MRGSPGRATERQTHLLFRLDQHEKDNADRDDQKSIQQRHILRAEDTLERRQIGNGELRRGGSGRRLAPCCCRRRAASSLLNPALEYAIRSSAASLPSA